MEGQFNCDVCDIKCTGIEPYMQHMNSIRHKKRVEQEKLKTTFKFDGSCYYCQTCDVSCSGISPYKQHLISEKHVKKEQAKQLCREKCGITSSDMLDTPEIVYHRENAALPVQTNFQCLICVKTFTGPVPYEQHMNSAVHQKNLKKIELQAALKCGKSEVSSSVSSEEMSEMVVDNSPLKGIAQDSTICSPGNLPYSMLSPHELLHHISSGNGNTPVGECYICKVNFYSCKDHYESESHLYNQNIYEYKRKVKVFVPEEPFDLSA